MSESRSEVVDIYEVAMEDMEVVLKFIYGVLDAIPGEQLHSVLLASNRLQVYCCHTEHHISLSTILSYL